MGKSCDEIDHESIVTSFYRHILKRAPDPHGMETFLGLIERKGISDSIEQMFSSFFSCDEFLALNPQKNDSSSLSQYPQSELINGKPISHIVSLGTHCLASGILQKHNLKKYSLPFDWIFTSPNSIMDCFENNFERFLDRKYYRSIKRATGEPGAHHSWYLDNHGISDFFTHRDPVNEKDYAYYQRTVDRFKRLMLKDEAKLFIMISDPWHDLRKHFVDLSSAVNSLTKDAALICIQLRPWEAFNRMRLVEKNKNNALYEFTPCSKESGAYFSELVDELEIIRLIGQYNVQLVERL
ncbi:hypothetical protein BN59_02857 [Legionella massiliensis]|uniref:DUF4214 domain-containing protein n=1 Tax=Legionella massiliensis TaxID=1034943 RepID=A0A078KZW1_9GAMM|nr:DUF1796 family putative cysteine peptidase [Legionella massiliensis]CDZ78547.1 hypothetical protein BN59_02857 [Legionella massiliensis]CEE14285.1 hypothetical protein BN1094_02857 [Legionella massiliensis]